MLASSHAGVALSAVHTTSGRAAGLLCWALGLAAFTVLAPIAAHAGYEFSVSADSTDPYVNTAPPAHWARNLYLWLTCTDEGLAGLDATIETNLPLFGFTPLNNVLNLGGSTSLRLVVPGCPQGADIGHLLGYWAVWDTGGQVCLTPGQTMAINCDPNPEGTWNPVVVGFSSDSSSCSSAGVNGCLGYSTIISSFRAHQGYGELAADDNRFDACQATIEYEGDPTFVDAVSNWVGIDNQQWHPVLEAWLSTHRHLQAGWYVRHDQAEAAVYFEWFDVNGEHPKLRATPVPGDATYKVVREGDFYRAYYDGAGIGPGPGRPVADFRGPKLCRVAMTSERHHEDDNYPGVPGNPIWFLNGLVYEIRPDWAGWRPISFNETFNTYPNDDGRSDGQDDLNFFSLFDANP